jgi:predicted transcriptional regulator
MSRTRGVKPILPDDVNRAARADMAVKLRIAGASQREIARATGLSQSAVSRVIKRALSEQRQQSAEELRAVEGARLEE